MPSRHTDQLRAQPDLLARGPVARHLNSLKAVRAAAATCQRCPLYRDATQTVR